MKKNKYFKIVKLNLKINSKVKKEYFKLKNDPYSKNANWFFRKRSFAQGFVKNNKIRWRKSTSFFQSKKINKYAGGIKRKFPRMSINLKNFVEEILKKIFFTLPLFKNKKFSFGAHAIRIVCNKKNKGFPVPEGFHHDGVDFASIIPINKEKCIGGISYLKKANNNKILLKNSLRAGEILIFNDKKLLHYATPIKHISGSLGFRDIFVFTFLKSN